ncbi:glutamate 5-kinase [Actinomycetospora callitridis]|uniref:glutamate 5-kinase n=1 Tax=Actinomycetospora callitridis TaxID=913944 RepID=UPI0023660DFB|nr:glutamate 5-kinase [Actinomycetospora callitridis]MDD7919373.1 glutamate 5-kinase [Actinomycetospora callitridis]
MTAREAVAGARRLVVKIGSTSLTSVDGGLDVGRLDALVDAVAARAAGTQVVLVSSGAIAAGLRPLGLPRRPRDLATQQAAAGVGQLHLTRAYAEAFARHGRTVGQVLLTSHDVVRRQPYRNAQRTFERLLGLGVVPVVNENDTVATDEIRFGDNDRLAALVAHVISADALVLLSDVAGVYDADPRDPGATLVREVTGGADLAGVRVGKTSSLGTGGMASKLAAADLASGAGVPVLVAAAADAPAALDGAEVGTVFAPHGPRLSARRFWLRHMAGTRGRLHLDAGAVKAVVGRRRSLLAAGIVGSDGDFEAGDVVDLVDPRGDVVARGVVAFDAEELPEISGRSSEDLAPEHRREVVHADDLVPVGATLVGTGPAATTPAPTDPAGTAPSAADPTCEPAAADPAATSPPS